MQLKKLRLAPVCLALSTACSMVGQSTPTRVAVVVTDQEGAVVAHAQVRFMDGPNPVGQAATDDMGQLTVDLKPGLYRLSASAAGFKPYMRDADVLPTNKAQIFPVMLGAAPIDGMQVTGAVDPGILQLLAKSASVTLKPADLKAMTHITVTVHNLHTNADETYSGVRLADLLTKVSAPLGKDLRGEALANYVIAIGSDGYKAVLALGEVDSSFHPGEVIVADAMDGKPLDAHNGPLKLVVTEDKRPARWVRNLTTLELKSAQ